MTEEERRLILEVAPAYGFDRHKIAAHLHISYGRLNNTIDKYLRTEWKEARSDWHGKQRPAANIGELESKILQLTRKKPATILSLADAFDRSPQSIREALKHLEQAGSGVKVSDDSVTASLAQRPVSTPARVEWSGEVLRFCEVSDTHLGSKYEQLGPLNAVYDECEARGIDLVLHPGDWVDGENMYRGHVYEIHTHGADDQRKYASANYPKRKGIRTKGIGGNHDASFLKTAGYDIVQALAKERPDIEYLGPVGRMIDLECKSRKREVYRVHLMHPRGSVPYAKSYRVQKIVEGYEGGSKPDMLLAGHLHYQAHAFIRNVHAFQVPCFQRQTPFLKELGLEPVVGAYFFEVEFSKSGAVGRLQQELVTWYVPDPAGIAA